MNRAAAKNVSIATSSGCCPVLASVADQTHEPMAPTRAPVAMVDQATRRRPVVVPAPTHNSTAPTICMPAFATPCSSSWVDEASCSPSAGSRKFHVSEIATTTPNVTATVRLLGSGPCTAAAPSAGLGLSAAPGAVGVETGTQSHRPRAVAAESLSGE
jgi:hypothetical protein